VDQHLPAQRGARTRTAALRMNLLDATKRRTGFWSAAGACLLTITLLASVACGPTCAGSTCVAKATTNESKSICHSMATHTEDALSGSTKLHSCGSADATMAMPGKPVATTPTLAWISFLGVSDAVLAPGQTIYSLIQPKDSPPTSQPYFNSTVVLRV